MHPSFVLKNPIITEKSIRATSRNRFTFLVSRHATKNQIKEAVAKTFGVTVVKVQTLVNPTKTRRAPASRQLIRIEPTKKAIVELKSGEKIDLFTVSSPEKS